MFAAARWHVGVLGRVALALTQDYSRQAGQAAAVGAIRAAYARYVRTRNALVQRAAGAGADERLAGAFEPLEGRSTASPPSTTARRARICAAWRPAAGGAA
jgi:hypothetical protein